MTADISPLNFPTMNTPLLATKFYLPPPRPGLVARPRLASRLEAGLAPGCRLILISAPAGSGKTTLLSEWIEGLRAGNGAHPAGRLPSPRLAWLSLDPEDNDPLRFWTYLVAALRSILPGAASAAAGGGPALRAMPAAGEGGSGSLALHALLTPLLNELAALPEPALLVLDDYHTITTRSIHDGLAFLLEHLPPQAHLVISTRTDPALPLSRLRARGQLVALRAADLLFTSQETAAFLNGALAERGAAPLAPEDLQILEARTEGWIVGVQMAAIALQELLSDPAAATASQVKRFLAGFSGSNRYILDYLVEEVLDHLPQDLQAFLLQTSILDRLTAPLCDAILAGDEAVVLVEAPLSPSQAILESLEASNLFVVPLDAERRWYRYHHLFVELLRARLRQSLRPASTGADPISGLHHRAAAWFEAAGLLEEAFHHAVAAGELERAAALLDGHFLAALTQNRTPTLLEAVLSLPEPLTLSWPGLGLSRAYMLLINGRREEMRRLFAALEPVIQGMGAPRPGETDAEAQARQAEAGLYRGMLAAFQALEAGIYWDTAHAADLARTADALLPPGSLFRTMIPYTLGRAHQTAGNLAAADAALDELLRQARASGDLAALNVACTEVASQRKLQGRLRAAAELYAEDVRGIQTAGLPGPLPIGLELGLAEIRLEWDDLPAVRSALAACTERLAAGESPLARDWAHLLRARLCWAEGDLPGVRQDLQAAVQIMAQATVSPLLRATLDHWQVRLWAADGQSAADLPEDLAALLAGEQSSSPGQTTHFGARLLRGLARARLLVAVGNPHGLALLDTLTATARSEGWVGLLVPILAFQAAAHQAAGNGDQAEEALLAALALTAPEGWRRVFLEEGLPMAAALQALRAKLAVSAIRLAAREEEHLGYLLAAFEPASLPTPDLSPSIRPPSLHPIEPLLEPLSGREQEILALLADGLGNADIATRLIVAPGTVKAHLASIYRKLDVHTRTQALARARELGLLS